METFALAAISLTIAVSLLVNKRSHPLHRSFAAVCLVLAVERGSWFLFFTSAQPLWLMLHAACMAALAPLTLILTRRFITIETGLLSRRTLWIVLAAGMVLLPFVIFFRETPYFFVTLLRVYFSAALGICAIALVQAAGRAQGGHKKRLVYIIIALGSWAVLSLSDIFHGAGFGVPALSEIAAAALLYFILIVIVYPRLPELYEIMARAAIIVLLVLFAAALFYVVTAFFGQRGRFPDFNLILMTSFLIVIFIDPVKVLLKRATSRLFFDGRVPFTSLFALDEEMSKEKTLLLEEMARGLAHEIRNPLGSLKGAAQYLKDEADPVEAKELLGVITEETDRLEKVVSRFLSYANPYVLNARRQDLNRIVERALDLIRRDSVPDTVLIRTGLASDLPFVKLDEEQFMQVIFNVALNALEAMPDGGELTITSALTERDGSRAVELGFRDTGQGIAREDLKKVCKPFFTTKKGGTGLGLAICTKIVAEHGGFITVSSHRGKGTVLHIVLPVS